MRMIIRHSNLWPGSGGYLVLHNHSSVRHSPHKSGVTTFGAPLGIQWGVFSYVELPAKLPVSLRAGPAQAALPPRPPSSLVLHNQHRTSKISLLIYAKFRSQRIATLCKQSRFIAGKARQGKLLSHALPPIALAARIHHAAAFFLIAGDDDDRRPDRAIAAPIAHYRFQLNTSTHTPPSNHDALVPFGTHGVHLPHCQRGCGARYSRRPRQALGHSIYRFESRLDALPTSIC